MLDSFLLFAQVNVPAATPAAPQGGDGGMMWFFVMLPAFLLIIWLFMMNPQKKQEERLRKMLDSLEKNDKVMTVGGVIGTVHTIDKEQNEIVLKVDEASNTRIRFHLTAVSTVFPKESSGKDSQNK